MKLPKITICLDQLVDPAWVPRYVGDMAVNMDTYYLHGVEVEAEVVSLHIAKGTMRIRYQWNGRTEVRDLGADEFFNQ
jgi:hypothetical protein